MGPWETWESERCPCPGQGDWMTFEVHSNPNHSMILLRSTRPAIKPPWACAQRRKLESEFKCPYHLNAHNFERVKGIICIGWDFDVLLSLSFSPLTEKYKGKASRKSLKLSCYNNPHALSPPLPLTQLRGQLIPMTEAELAPCCWWKQEVLTFCSCHPLTKAGFDSHLILQWVDWNNKSAEKY